MGRTESGVPSDRKARKLRARPVHIMRTRPTSIGETGFNIFFGFLFALVGLCGAGGVVLSVASRVSEPTGGLQRLPMNLFAATTMGAVAFVGVSMVAQGLRRRPGIEGIFYVSARHFAKRFAPLHVWLTAFVLSFLPESLACVLRPSSNNSSFCFGVSSVLILALFHISFHELGHFVAIRATGSMPHQIIAGPFAVLVSPKQAIFSQNRDWRLVAGGVVMWTAWEPPSARQQFLIAAAGPAATGGLVLLGLLVGIALSPSVALTSVLESNLSIGLMTLAINLVPLPLTPMGVASDGYQMFQACARLWR